MFRLFTIFAASSIIANFSFAGPSMSFRRITLTCSKSESGFFTSWEDEVPKTTKQPKESAPGYSAVITHSAGKMSGTIIAEGVSDEVKVLGYDGRMIHLLGIRPAKIILSTIDTSRGTYIDSHHTFLHLSGQDKDVIIGQQYYGKCKVSKEVD